MKDWKKALVAPEDSIFKALAALDAAALRLALVADADCRLLLELRYLSMKRWEDIAGEMQMCRTSVYLLHQRALDMVETILRTREECARHDG